MIDDTPREPILAAVNIAKERISPVKSFIRLHFLNEEGLRGPDCARSLNDAVQICAAEGEWDRESAYARLASETYNMGGNFEAANEVARYIEAPRTHPQAGKKQKNNVWRADTNTAMVSSKEMLQILHDSLDMTAEQEAKHRSEWLERASVALAEIL